MGVLLMVVVIGAVGYVKYHDKKVAEAAVEAYRLKVEAEIRMRNEEVSNRLAEIAVENGNALANLERERANTINDANRALSDIQHQQSENDIKLIQNTIAQVFGDTP